MRYSLLTLVVASRLFSQTLDGMIDMHAHSDPDGTARKIDATDLARLAKSRGIRGLVLKNHYEPTASLAYVVRKEVPGIEVFGGISLDLTVGGVNPAAVEWMTKVKGGLGKVVWMPTFDSEAQVKLTKQDRPYASVAKDGKLLPETVKVIEVVAKNNLVLETGHSSPAETLLLIKEAKARGVQNVLVTHAMTSPGGPLSLTDMQQAAKMGAYLELVYSPFTEEYLKNAAEAIRSIGPASWVVSSDLGQPTNPLHPDGLMALCKGLMTHGITVQEINLMTKTNPAKLLGLKP